MPVPLCTPHCTALHYTAQQDVIPMRHGAVSLLYVCVLWAGVLGLWACAVPVWGAGATLPANWALATGADFN